MNDIPGKEMLKLFRNPSLPTSLRNGYRSPVKAGHRISKSLSVQEHHPNQQKHLLLPGPWLLCNAYGFEDVSSPGFRRGTSNQQLSNILRTLWLANITRMKFIIRRKLLFSPSSTLQECSFAAATAAPLAREYVCVRVCRQSYKIIIMDMLKRSKKRAHLELLCVSHVLIMRLYFGACLPSFKRNPSIQCLINFEHSIMDTLR